MSSTNGHGANGAGAASDDHGEAESPPAFASAAWRFATAS